MCELLTIWLAGDVKGKGRPRFARRTGHAYTPAATVNYEAALRMAAQEAMGTRPLFDGPVRIAITADFGIPASYSQKQRGAALIGATKPTKKPDWDNIAKLTDALNGVVWLDDKQITDATFAKRYAEKPGLLVTVSAA